MNDSNRVNLPDQVPILDDPTPVSRCVRMSWYEDVPKVELHLHLEGAVPIEAQWELMQKYGGDPDVPDLETLRGRFVFESFPQFLQTFRHFSGFIREPEDLRFIAAATARDLVRQNIVYAELITSVPRHQLSGIPLGRAIEAVRQGLDEVPGIEVRLIPDLVRDYGAQTAMRTAVEVCELQEFGVAGITIGGDEAEHAAAQFADAYEHVRRAGLNTSAHAGEGDGPASVWGALSLTPDRIGHGTRAVEDPALLEELARRNVVIEMCPFSNLRTGVIERLEDHPARRFVEAGIPVTVNTDDPTYFGNSLAMEYEALERRLGFTRAEICLMIETAADASWLPAERRAALVEHLRGAPWWIGH